jgi:hypothetical protein
MLENRMGYYTLCFGGNLSDICQWVWYEIKKIWVHCIIYIGFQ